MKKLANNVRRHSAIIFTSISVVGVIGTAILGVRAGMEAERIKASLGELPENRKERYKLIAKETWKCYVLVSLMAIISAGAAIASHKISAKDIARLATLATGSGAAFSKYRSKIREVLGDEKEKELYEKVKVEGPGICYPRIIDHDDENYNNLYVRYRLDFGVPELKPIEFASNPERVTAAFYCINRDFALGRMIDVALAKDFLGIEPIENIDHKYFWIDSMFYESGENPWIDFTETFQDDEDKDGNVIHTITVEVPPVDNETLEKIESGEYWDEWRV